MYINLPIPDKKCSMCGAINQTESVRRDKGFGRTSVILRCTICGHTRVEAEETTYQSPDVNGYYIYNLPPLPDVDEF